MRFLPRSPSPLAIALVALLVVLPVEVAADSSSASVYFCRCQCFDKSRIVPLYRPKDPAKPCLTCTKQFCLDQQLSICKGASKGDVNPDTGTGDEGDVSAKCFLRDSMLAKTSVISFILLVTALLIGAVAKDRLRDSTIVERIQGMFARTRRRPRPGSGLYAAMPT